MPKGGSLCSLTVKLLKIRFINCLVSFIWECFVAMKLKYSLLNILSKGLHT